MNEPFSIMNIELMFIFNKQTAKLMSGLTALPISGAPEQGCQIIATTFIYKNVS